MTQPHPFSHLVVIGSSAGGIDALTTLVATLPTPFAAPIVLAQHLDPSRPSHLRDILARHSTLPVQLVRDQEPLEAGVIYVVPPNQYVEITATGLHLRADLAERLKPSIDLLFSSAAQVYGEQVIALVLSGTGSDGADGARQVKQAGGTVLIQDPTTASYPTMPLALAPTIVDLVAPLDRLGPLLASLVAGLEPPFQPDSKQTLDTFLHDLNERLGLDFSGYKTPTLLRRLQRRILATGATDLAGYQQYLEGHPEEYQRLATTFLINITEFFREADLFVRLRTQTVPDLLADAQRTGRELRLWSAGCATGEEAYSLAIVLLEALQTLPEAPKVRIFATDIDAEAIAFARRGRYPAAALMGVSQERLDRYFIKGEGFYQVAKPVRSLLVFGQHDLGQRAAFPQLDLVLCRNVLIYFGPALQQRVLHLFAYALREGGYLALGKAESVGALSEVFAQGDKTLKLYRRQGVRVVMPPARLPGPLTPLPSSARMTKQSPGGLEVPRSTQELHQLRYVTEGFLFQFPVGLVVVDRHLDIQAINTTARRALGIHGPAVGEDLLHLVQGLPMRQLQTTIERAFRTGTPTRLEEVAIEDLTTGEPVYLQLLCQPQRETGKPDQVERVLIVSYDVTALVRARLTLTEQLQQSLSEADRVQHEAAVTLAQREEALSTELEQVRQEAAAAASQREQAFTAELERVRREAARELAQRKEEALAEADRLRQVSAAELARQEALNRQLADLNHQLVEANEELSRANEALRMESEENVIRTEEAQAVAEESETLNEEMQATNEEMETLNEEYQSAIEELKANNASLEVFSRDAQALVQTREAELSHLATGLLHPSAAVAVIDQTGALRLSNAVFAARFGHEGTQLVPQDAHGQPLPPEDTPQQRAARGETFRLEFGVASHDGTTQWFVALGQPLHGEEAALRGGVLSIERLPVTPA